MIDAKTKDDIDIINTIYILCEKNSGDNPYDSIVKFTFKNITKTTHITKVGHILVKEFKRMYFYRIERSV